MIDKNDILEALRLGNLLKITFTSLFSGDERSIVCKQPWMIRTQNCENNKLVVWRSDTDSLEDIEWSSIQSWKNGGKCGSSL